MQSVRVKGQSVLFNTTNLEHDGPPNDNRQGDYGDKEVDLGGDGTIPDPNDALYDYIGDTKGHDVSNYHKKSEKTDGMGKLILYGLIAYSVGLI